jgi:hypothetical protein
MNLDFKRQTSQQTSFVALVPLSQKTLKKLHISAKAMRKSHMCRQSPWENFMSLEDQLLEQPTSISCWEACTI